MVSKLLRAGSNGVSDWIIQRVTAVILALYAFFWVGVFCYYPQIDYSVWSSIFSCTVVQIFTLLALISLLLHAWVGIWTVLTDYIKCAYFRLTLQVLLILALFIYFVWGIKILWGVAA